MKYTYDNFPIKLFSRILSDEEGNRELIDEGWESVKEKFLQKHQTGKDLRILEAQRSALIESIVLKKLVLLLKLFAMDPYDASLKEFFEEAKMPYNDDPNINLEYLKKETNKSRQKVRIYEARLEKVIEESKEDEGEDVDPIENVNKALASLEMSGASIPDYDKFTLGQYDAWTELNKDKNGRRID